MITLSFHGAVKAVTGSCHLLTSGNESLLIDCGIHQGERVCHESNHEAFDFDISTITAVLVTHAHYDHCGRLPLLIKRGYKGLIFCTPPTKPLIELILRDGLNMMREHAQLCGDTVLYEEKDITETMTRIRTMNYHTDFSPSPAWTCAFFDAGHILGSAFVKIVTEGKTVIFSGDLGNSASPILPNTETLPVCDAIIMETTYGDRNHDPAPTRDRHLAHALNTILTRGGTAIIPAFALERTQELLYALDHLVDQKLIPRIPIYFDSPLAIKATEIYREYSDYLQFDSSILTSVDRDFFSFPGLKVCLSVDDSRLINTDTKPKIIIAGSGMMTGGRVLHHLKRYLSDEKSGVIIIGYQAEGSLGRSIQDGAKEVRIHDASVAVRATIFEVESFSAHADKSQLEQWVKKEGVHAQVFLVHGDASAKEQFKKILEQAGCKKVSIPTYRQRIDIA